ncbi:MAG TPA: UvrD-helicase domain-containing protein [Verrucomicrobiae bacterium]
MELPRQENRSLTESQQQAVAARGNVLVMAGAGTGKTKTLVARCLDCLARERASLDELLIVTFTEAAAAEMRRRLRKSLEEKISAHPDDAHWQEQLARFDLAHIGTLHSFCLRLVREHFYELGLDPQLAVLDEGKARQLANETLDELFQAHYAGENEFSITVQNLIQVHGNGRDENIRKLVLRLHHYSQTRPDAAGWLAEQIQKFSATDPADWQRWLLVAIKDWRDEWLPVLETLRSENEKAAELAGVFQRLGNNLTREFAAEMLQQIVSAGLTANYPKGKAGKLRPALGGIFDEAAFLSALAPVRNGIDPLAEDWTWIRGQMETLLRLAQEYAGKFSERKRADGVLDFHDLEQFALKLLWDFSTNKPTAVAEAWRAKLRFVFVDEYQDINAAQDKIIAALSRDGSGANRFLVGDVKQSIYRFRLADPRIFRDYSKTWHGESGKTIPLSENFRSRESLLDFANSVFSLIMREEIGGVAYDADAELKFGSPETRTDFSIAKNPSPRAELLLRLKPGRDEIAMDDEFSDLAEADKEARLVALRLKKLIAEKHEIWDDDEKIFRAAEWRDVAVLLRSPAGKAEIFAKQFELAGVPLVVARGGFFDGSEILDLLSLLQLLDNPLQDVPCIAVLRSPLVGLSLDELAEIRLAAKDKHFWTALNRIQNEKLEIKNELDAKTARFLERFSRWRKLAKQQSLSECLEAVLAETLYADWLRAQPRGAQRAANIGRFLNLAQSFDQFQRQGLFRFLKFIEAQREAGAEPDAPVVAAGNTVRLMSIHQSKGLEFPVVVLPDLAKKFNEQDLRGEIIFDEELGLCPKVKPPSSGRRYPSLPHWLAQHRQKRELRGEELRLLYVALTRARDTLILSATVTEKKWETLWTKPEPVTSQKIADANCFADWLGLWFGIQSRESTVQNGTSGEFPHLRWRLVEDEELADVDSVKNGTQKSEAELPALNADEQEKLRAVLSWQYPQQPATKQKAKASVTELRRAAEELDDEAEPFFARPGFVAANRRSKIADQKLSAAEAGTVHHKFLQHFALKQNGDLAAEAERLVRGNYLSVDERSALDLEALEAFWDSELGEKILANAENVRRELPFTARFSPAEIAQITGAKAEAGLENEFIVVQGVVDLAVLLPDEIWLVDFKTDGVRADELAQKIKTYTPQLRLYAAALEKIFARQVTLRALHFLAARRTVEI